MPSSAAGRASAALAHRTGRPLRRMAAAGVAMAALLAPAPGLLAATSGQAAPAKVAPVETGKWVHALSAYQPPKYPKGFAHFDYVNPDAPKGGVLRLRNPDRRSSFDKYNPFTTKGVPPAGVVIFMVESLAHMGQDEPLAMYGLLAEEMLVAPDMSSVSFRLHPKARFSNGDPVTPADVVHSWRSLSGPQAWPLYRTPLAGIEQAVAIDTRTVRFDLKERSIDALFNAGTMPVFSRKWGEGKKLDEIVTEFPVMSGPYVIDKAEMPRRIEFKRNPDYWAKDLGVRRGHFNFDRVVYRLYKDQAVGREAFKAGEFDIYKEYAARAWARQHQGAKWRDGRIVKHAYETATGEGMQAALFNVRRPLLQDVRVREALTLAFDYDKYNRFGTFQPTQSVFPNSEFAAADEPSAGELALLEPLRAQIPPRVFGPAFKMPRTNTGPNALRQNLRRARDLLAEAGWKVGADGKLRNAAGEALELEFMEPNQTGRVIDWQRNLEKLGVTLKERLVDFSLFRRRLETFDFDIVVIVNQDFTLPRASDMANLFGSKAADVHGSSNWRGVKSPAVDRLIEAMEQAGTYEELRDAARALDRVVMWSFFQSPQVYNNTEQISYWDRFGIPKVVAHHFKADTLITGFTEYAPWPLWTWWDKSLEKPASVAGR
jgi:peptide/nickel transport system substrate-binding protein/microcin C transport system substrate-binding protein